MFSLNFFKSETLCDTTNRLAEVFGVSTSALTVPDIDSYNGLMHTLFALEDLYGFKITELDKEFCLHLYKGISTIILLCLVCLLFGKNRLKN